MKKRLLSLLLALCLIVSVLPVMTFASEPEAAATVPVRAEFLGGEIKDLSASEKRPTLNASYYTSLQAAGEYLRERLVANNSNNVVSIATEYYTDEDLEYQAYEILAWALAHTGNPKEGDYLTGRIQEFLEISVDGYVGDDGIAYLDYTFRANFYTSSSQEEGMDRDVQMFMDKWDVYDADPFDQLMAIYLYANRDVEYDGPVTKDTLQSSLYACQVFWGNGSDYAIALWFYRMALEYGIDCRVISGTVGDDVRYWNIVYLDGVYYNVDAALDAETEGFAHFMKSDETFADHIRDESYADPDFYEYYPMAGEDINHKYDQGKLTTEASCTAEGVMTYTCTDCGYAYTRKTGLAPHQYVEEITKAPTCTEPGEFNQVCKVCGETITGGVMDPTGHDYTSEVTKKSTCAEKGEVTYTCKACAHTYTEELALLEHTYESAVTTEPTCDKEGVRTYTCTGCGSSYTEPIETIAHNFVDDVCTGCGGGAVYRISGDSRYATAYAAADELKEIMGVERFNTIIVACGDNFADALAGSYLASVRKAPILLQNGSKSVLNSNVAYIKENLAEGGRVCILGGKNSVPETLDEALEAEGIYIQRFAGSNRFETNLAILESAGVGSKEILVCTAYNFADSLSASAAGLPILLVNNNSGALTSGQKAFLETLDGNAITIIGGVNSVSEALEKALGEYSDNVTRIAGDSREETSVLFARKYFKAPEYAMLAYSRNFPDGLCGGPLAYAMGAPLLLTSAGNEKVTAGYVAEAGIIKGYVLGGEAAIKDASVKTVFAMGEFMEIMTK